VGSDKPTEVTPRSSSQLAFIHDNT